MFPGSHNVELFRRFSRLGTETVVVESNRTDTGIITFKMKDTGTLVMDHDILNVARSTGRLTSGVGELQLSKPHFFNQHLWYGFVFFCPGFLEINRLKGLRDTTTTTKKKTRQGHKVVYTRKPWRQGLLEPFRR
jgi:hypothetical protein